MTKKLLGIYILIIGFSILLKTLFFNIKIIYILFFLLMIISIHMTYIAISIKKKRVRRLLIPGITFLLLSIFFLIHFLFLSSFISLKNTWPIIGFFPSVGLILYYLLSKKKSPTTIIPGIFIGILSLVILLITNGIFNFKFLNFLIISTAGMLIFIGLYLIFNLNFISFNKQQKEKKKKKDKINNTLI